MGSNNTAEALYKLVTVNPARERARRLVGHMIEALKGRYDIVHAANCERIDQVESTVATIQPDLLFCASMWTADEAEQIQAIARRTKPGIATYAIPHGLQVEEGPDAIVNHLLENVPKLLDTIGK